MLTTSSFEAHNTIPSQGRSHPMISCASGPRTFVSGWSGSPSTTPNIWMTASLPGWFRSFTLPHIARSAEPNFHSTMSQEQGDETWRVRKGRGLDSRVVGVRKIKVQATGVMRWTTNSGIGTGPNLCGLVCVPIYQSQDPSSNSMVLTKVRSLRRST